MKKLVSIMVAMVFILSLGTGLKAEDKELNLMANIGMAFSDFEGLVIDLGVEKQFSENLFALLYLDYYLNPTGEDYGANASLTLMGINLGAAYKKQLNEKIKWFVRAGILIAIAKAEFTLFGYTQSETDSNFGLSAGGGIEYMLQEKLSLVAGVALATVFSDGSATWFKIFAGVNYKLK